MVTFTFRRFFLKIAKVGEGTISTGLFSNGHQLAPPSAIGRHLPTSPALICIRFISMLMKFLVQLSPLMTLQQRKVFVPTSSSGKIRIIFKQTLQSTNLTSRDTQTADDWPSRFANSEKSSEYRLNILI